MFSNESVPGKRSAASPDAERIPTPRTDALIAKHTAQNNARGRVTVTDAALQVRDLIEHAETLERELARELISGASIAVNNGQLRYEAAVKAATGRAACPDCYRFKARNADDCAAGDCSKWYAIRDKEADHDCADFRNKTGYWSRQGGGDAGR